MEIKYGKIKCPSNFSNIFGTTVQLVIRMKSLMEGQFDLYKKIPNSEVIPTVIDAYEQLKFKIEYLDINPFIHRMKNEINLHNKNIDFQNFFASVLSSIDFSNTGEIQCISKPLIFTSLYSKKDQKDVKSYFFEISIENNQKLSTIIENSYEFSKDVYYKPEYLFFIPIINGNSKINIDEKLNFKLSYTLSFIVARKIQKDAFNHFVLFIGISSWIRIEDDKIIALSLKDVFNEVSNQNVYQIEILGYCSNPSKSIFSVDKSGPKNIKIIEINQFNQKENSNQSFPIYSNMINKFRVNYVEFDYLDYSYRFISSKIFNTSTQRDQYLKELDEDSKYKNIKLYYNSGKYFGFVQCFDDIDKNITVFTVEKNNEKSLLKPIEILFYNKEEIKWTRIELFYPKITINQLFDYCLNNLPEKPSILFIEKEKGYHKIERNKNLIKSIIEPGTSAKIFYSTNKQPEINIQEKQENNSLRVNYQKQPEIKIQEKQDKQIFNNTAKTVSKPSIFISQKQEDKLNVLKCLKSFLYDDKKSIFIKKVTIENKSNLNFPLKKLHSELFINQKYEILTYVIEYENNFTVKFFDNEKTIIKNVPSSINTQFRPNKNKDYRVCILKREPILSHDDKNNQNIFSFIVNFDGYYSMLVDEIASYLYHNESERNLFTKKDYIPKLYIYENNEFVEINDKNDIKIKESKLKPVFVIWKSSSVYDTIIKLIQKHIVCDKIDLS